MPPVLERGSKRDLLHIKKFVFTVVVYPNCAEYDVRQLNDNELNMVSNMTSAKRSDSSILRSF